jgi:hypothetical protein
MIVATSQSATDTAQTSMSGPNAKTPEATIVAAKTHQAKPAPPDQLGKLNTPAARAKRVAAQQKAAVKKRASARAKPTMSAKPKSSRKPSGQSVKRKVSTASAKPVIGQYQVLKKARKVKVIRDSFTMPAADYERIGVLKEKCLAIGVAMKKSELLRAGLATLELLSSEDLKRVVAAVESIKTGRPAGKKKKSKGKASKKHRKS